MKNTLKKISLSLLAFNLVLSGCASINKAETPIPGIINSVDKIADKDKKPSVGTKNGVLTGVSLGGVVGAIGGGVIGTGVTIATFGLAAPSIPGFVAAGAATGAGAGAVIGGTTGYVYDYKAAGSGLYEYKVLTQSEGLLTIRQICDEPFKLDENIYVIWEKNQRKIIPIKSQN